MPSLREWQRAFAQVVLAPEEGADLGAQWIDRPQRMAVYRNTVFGNYRNALAATYSVVKRIVGAPFFNAAVDSYAREHPSRSGDLNVYGKSFGDFLAAYPHAANLPYLPDVARLEWAIDEANRAPDTLPAPDTVLAALSIAPPEGLTSLRLRLEPSCRLIASEFPILRIWQVNQPDNEDDWEVDFGRGGDTLLIRREGTRPSISRIAIGDHAWLAALANGASLGAALEAALTADAAFDFSTALREHVASGTIAGVMAS